MRSDAEIVARAVRGEPGAFTELADRYYEDCLRFSWRLLGSREDAEDAVQEAFLSVFRSLPRYSERERFRSWLWQILVNQCRAVGRRRARWDRRVVQDEEAVAAAPARSAEPSELLDALDRALATLELPQREALLLKYGEGLEYAEMARITGVGISALKMRVRRAADSIRPHLEAMLRE